MQVSTRAARDRWLGFSRHCQESGCVGERLWVSKSHILDSMLLAPMPKFHFSFNPSGLGKSREAKAFELNDLTEFGRRHRLGVNVCLNQYQKIMRNPMLSKYKLKVLLRSKLC